MQPRSLGVQEVARACIPAELAQGRAEIGGKQHRVPRRSIHARRSQYCPWDLSRQSCQKVHIAGQNLRHIGKHDHQRTVRAAGLSITGRNPRRNRDTKARTAGCGGLKLDDLG